MANKKTIIGELSPKEVVKTISKLPKKKKEELRITFVTTLALLSLIGVFISSPKLFSYFQSHPSQASDSKLINPNFSPDSNPLDPSDTPWGNLPSEKILISKHAAQPKIYGDRVVYRKYDLNYSETNQSDIYMYNLHTNEETPISINNNLREYSPDIYGDHVVWVSSQYNGIGPIVSNIILFNLATEEKINITNDNGYDSNNSSPAIYGNNVIWIRYSHEAGEEEFSQLMLYKINTQETVVLRKKSLNLWEPYLHPDIFRDIVVWQTNYYYSPTINILDISSGDEKEITNYNNLQQCPAVYYPWVIWHERMSQDDFKIVGYNIKQDQKIDLVDFSSTGGFSGYPAIYGNSVVYSGNKITANWNFSDILLHNIFYQDTEEDIVIEDSDNSQLHPDIYQNWIAWEDRPPFGSNPGYPSIYAYNLN